MYNPDKYAEIKVSKEKVDTKVVSIDEGTQDTFRTDAYWEAVKDKSTLEVQKKKKCIQIKTENGASLVIATPENNAVHPKSTMAKFKKTYDSYPKIGMTVQTKPDENGFNRIVLEN